MAIYHNKKWLRTAYKKHGTLTGIANEIGVSITHVGRLMKKYGLEYKHTTEKGYKTIHGAGYVLIRVGVGYPHSTTHGYALEHRYIVEQHLGRYLTRNEHVHHINGDKQDNRLENLVVLTARQHRQEHTGPKRASVSQREKIESLSSTHTINQIAKIVGLCSPTVQRWFVNGPRDCGYCGQTQKNQKSLSVHFRVCHPEVEERSKAMGIFHKRIIVESE